MAGEDEMLGVPKIQDVSCSQPSFTQRCTVQLRQAWRRSTWKIPLLLAPLLLRAFQRRLVVQACSGALWYTPHLLVCIEAPCFPAHSQ